MPLEFDGNIQLLDVGQQYDLTFKTPTSSFQNFLGLVPSSFSGNIKDIKTTGDFSVAGSAKGIYSDGDNFAKRALTSAPRYFAGTSSLIL